MNIALEQTKEYVNGKLRRSYGDAFVRGNNGGSTVFMGMSQGCIANGSSQSCTSQRTHEKAANDGIYHEKHEVKPDSAPVQDWQRSGCGWADLVQGLYDDLES